MLRCMRNRSDKTEWWLIHTSEEWMSLKFSEITDYQIGIRTAFQLQSSHCLCILYSGRTSHIKGERERCNDKPDFVWVYHSLLSISLELFYILLSSIILFFNRSWTKMNITKSSHLSSSLLSILLFYNLFQRISIKIHILMNLCLFYFFVILSARVNLRVLFLLISYQSSSSTRAILSSSDGPLLLLITATSRDDLHHPREEILIWGLTNLLLQKRCIVAFVSYNLDLLFLILLLLFFFLMSRPVISLQEEGKFGCSWTLLLELLQ